MNPMPRIDMDPISGRRIERPQGERDRNDPRLLPPFPPPADDEDRLPLTGVFLTAVFAVVVVAAIWLIGRAINWTLIMDIIAPTAAQARDTGWAAIAERLP